MAKPDTIADVEEHKVKTGETLKSLAAAKGLTVSELAKFNFETDNPAQINEHLHNDVGCTRQDTSGNFIFDDNDDPGIILIPKKFERRGLATDKVHVFRVLEIEREKNFHECICFSGINFEFDKSFIRPATAESASIKKELKKLESSIEDFKKKNKGQHPAMIVFGHTDLVGSEQYNKDLSDRRAESAFALVTRQPDRWETLYKNEHEKWGIKAIQTMLKVLSDPDEPSFDPGTADGIQGDKTTAAIKAYQGKRGLRVDGDAGHDTRRSLFQDYMTFLYPNPVDKSRFFAPQFMGCGEFNPLVDPNEDERRNRRGGNEANRRVIFYLFRRPPRTIPCKLHDIGPCKTEIKKPGPRSNPLHTCAFYDSIAKECHCEERVEEFRIRLFDWLGNALPGAPCEITLAGKPAQRLTADDNGDIALRDASPGVCTVRWSRPESMREKTADFDTGSGDTDFIDRDGSEKKISIGPPELPEFEFEREVHVRLPEIEDEPVFMDEDAARKRLNNMGYSTAEALRDNIRAFQRDLGDQQSGELDDAEDKLKDRHDDKCQPPGNSSRR